MSATGRAGVWIAALLIAIGARGQSSGAAVGAPPPPLDQGLLDCSLYRYGDRLDAAVAETLERFATRRRVLAELQSAARRAERVDVTELLRRERLINRVLDCPQPVLRGFVVAEAVELEFIALQTTVCQQLVDSAALARLGARLRVRHGPSGEARCGVSRNPVPGLLTLGRLTQAGRILPGENTVTITLPGPAAGPAADPEVSCERDDQAPLSKQYRADLDRRPGKQQCSFGPLSKGALACKSLYDKSVKCSGSQVTRACEAGLRQVEQALAEFERQRPRLDGLSAEDRVGLLERLIGPTQLDRLRGVPSLVRYADLNQPQLDAVGAIFAGGEANMVPGFEAGQQIRYDYVADQLLALWVPKIDALRRSGETAEEVWARLTPKQRWDLILAAATIVNKGLGLRPRRLDAVGGCRSGPVTLLWDTEAGAYTSPGAKSDRADTIYLCGNGTASVQAYIRSSSESAYFGDLQLVLETLLHETLHAHQMEFLQQVAENGVSADRDTCTQARMMAAGWSITCTPSGTSECNTFYLSQPQEFQARFFSKPLTARVLDAMRQRP